MMNEIEKAEKELNQTLIESIERHVESLFLSRRYGVILGFFTDEEADKMILELSEKYQEKYADMDLLTIVREMQLQILKNEIKGAELEKERDKR